MDNLVLLILRVIFNKDCTAVLKQSEMIALFVGFTGRFYSLQVLVRGRGLNR